MDSGSVSPTAGLCVVTKLKYEHLYLSSFSKMRVDLAAQVLQHTASSSYYSHYYIVHSDRFSAGDESNCLQGPTTICGIQG